MHSLIYFSIILHSKFNYHQVLPVTGAELPSPTIKYLQNQLSSGSGWRVKMREIMEKHFSSQPQDQGSFKKENFVTFVKVVP